MRSTTDIERATPELAGHLTDAELLRILDGEPLLSTAPDVTSHLAACAACAARADLLRDRRRRLAKLLAESDVPVPALPALPAADELLARARRRRRSSHARPAVRAAAVLLLAGTLAAQPAVRRWVGAQWHRVTGSARTAGLPEVPAVVPNPAEGTTPGTGLAFEPGAGPFTIRFDTRPSAGTLTVVGVEGGGTRATVERVSGANLELLVTPHGLHVRNAGGAAASYLVRVPRSVGRVYLRFGASTSPDDVEIDVAGHEQRVIVFGR
jgi:hypothetical protein